MTASTELAHIRPISPDPLPESLVQVGASSAPVRFTGQWEELFWDLACLDPLWIETATPGVTLGQSVELQGIRFREDMGLAEGATFGLCCFLDEWHAMRPRSEPRSEEPRGLVIEARDWSRLLSLTPSRQTDAFALRVLTAVYRAENRPVVPFRRRTDTTSRLAKHLRDLVSYEDWSAHPLDVGDISEACGWLTLTPARMQVRGHIRLAAPELIPCLLETVADQGLGVRVLTGTAGVAQSFQGCFNAYWQRQDEWVELTSEGARLTLEPAAVDSAWVLERPGPEGPRHQLRLYDDHGRALLLMEDLPISGRAESPVWRTLVKAALD